MKTTRATVLATALFSALIAWFPSGAQTSPGAISAQQAPPSIGPMPSYEPPRMFTDQLPNGLKLVVVSDHRFPMISLRFAVKAGRRMVKPSEIGLLQAEAHLLTSGTRGFSAEQIAASAALFGGSIQGAAGPDFLSVSTGGLASHKDAIFRLLADVVLNPVFPAGEVALRKQNMLQELALRRSSSGFLAAQQFAKAVYGSDPYSWIAPTESSIRSITRQQLIDLHQQLLLPNNDAMLIVVGDISRGEARGLADQYFRDWRFGSPPAPQTGALPRSAARRVYLVNRPGSAQATIVIGNLGVTRKNPDYFPLLVANQVLGGSMNSLLMENLREKLGYTYGVYSVNRPLLKRGSWLVEMQVRNAVTGPAIAAALQQLRQFRSAPISADALRQAKNYLSGSFVRNLQAQGEIADEFLLITEQSLGERYLSGFVQRVQSVTAAQARAAAQKYMHPAHAAIIVVGDAARIQAALTQFSPAPVVILNERGQILGTFPAEGIPKVVRH